MRISERAGWLARICTPAVLVGTLSLAAVVAVYWFMALRPGTNPALVPTPPTIVKALREEIASGDLLVNTVARLRRVVIGFCIGASLALVLGALAGWFRYAGYVLNPIIDVLRPIPIPTDPSRLFALLAAPGIDSVPKLAGKRFAATGGTALHYFLARVLAKFDMKLSDVEFVKLAAADGRAVRGGTRRRHRAVGQRPLLHHEHAQGHARALHLR